MKNIVVVDIDGTLSIVGERLKYLKQSPKDWDAFYDSCFEDEPIQEVCDLVCSLWICGYKIIPLTGRRESVRKQTVKWMHTHVFKYISATPSSTLKMYPILMRPNNDYRHDAEVKLEVFKNAGYKVEDIAFVLEDRNSMVEMWRGLGVRCLQVADGNF